jgi:electron transfer flavoprotein beta subunit
MRIVVCVKQVVDVTFPFEIDPEKCEILPKDIFYVSNPADRCACEMAIQARERHGGEVIVISVGPPGVCRTLRSCLAMGADRAIHLQDREAQMDSFAVAYLLAKAMAPFSPDLILCGSRSADQMSGEVPPVLAELLDLPQGTGVMAMDLDPGGRAVTVQRRLERGRRQTILCPLPAVIAVEPGVAEPRYPSFPDLLAAHQAEIEELEIGDLGVDASILTGMASRRRLVRWSLPRPRPKRGFSIDSGLSADQRMELLMSGGLRQARTEILEGEPGQLARTLADMLSQRLDLKG